MLTSVRGAKRIRRARWRSLWWRPMWRSPSFSSCWHAAGGSSPMLKADSQRSRAQFRAARDELLALRTDYDRAVASFRWPDMKHFNWALDWFDEELAQGP